MRRASSLVATRGAAAAKRSGGVPRRAFARSLSTELQQPAEEPRGLAGDLGHYVGAPLSEFTEQLQFYHPQKDAVPPIMPTYRLIDDDGVPLPGAVLPDLDRETCVQMQQTMVRVNEFDKVFYDAQRQGRLSFYFTNRGEEAQAVGSAAALTADDWMWPQYRELGAIIWRGYTFEECANQCVGNELDTTKGRQLPMHIGSPEKRYMYVKSNLGQQVPAANGAAYAMKLFGKEQRADQRPNGCAITYFGEGCASEGDIPSALNIAAVHDCPTIFFCRNNGYAISTRTDDQYRSDGIAPRGVAYGLPSIRVDGNDILAVYAATAEARRLGIEEGKPTMIEGMSYRINSHSTSDDDSKYRRAEPPVEGCASASPFSPMDPAKRTRPFPTPPSDVPPSSPPPLARSPQVRQRDGLLGGTLADWPLRALPGKPRVVGPGD
jgi:2-oxoisovalerate dehydrogenase E1 component alpha subunit